MKRIKKRGSALCFMLMLTATLGISQTQLRTWHIAPDAIKFSDPNSSLAPNVGAFPVPTTNSAIGKAYNSICDNDGNLIFYIAGDNIYNKSNGFIGALPTTSVSRMEIAIVPNPDNATNECMQKYYVIFPGTPSGAIYGYGEVDMNGNSGAGSWTVMNSSLSVAGTPIMSLAVSRVNAWGKQFLYLTGQTSFNAVPTFEITATGIFPVTFSSVDPKMNVVPGGVEMELNNTGSKLVYSTTGGQLIVYDLDVATGKPLSSTPTSYATGVVNGIEVNNAGTKVFYSKPGVSGGVFSLDLITSAISSVLSSTPTNDHGSSMLEKDYKGNEIVCYANTPVPKLTAVNGNTGAVVWTKNQQIPSVTTTSPVFVMPDQVDGENYDVGKSVLIPSFTVNPVYCYGANITVNGSASYGMLNSVIKPNIISNHWWTVTECNASGSVLFGPSTIHQPTFYSPYIPGVYTFLPASAGGPVFNCGKYYQIKLTVQNCDVTQETVKVIYIECPPQFQLGPEVSICKGDCVTLGPTVGFGPKKKHNYQWVIVGDEPTPIGNGASISVCPTHTTTYCLTITSIATGCSSQECITVYVEDLNPTFSLNLNPFNPSYLQITATPFQTTAPTGFNYVWYVEELDASLVSQYTYSSYDLANPSFTNVSCWWSFPSPEVFDGFNAATTASLPVLDPIFCTPTTGRFKYNTFYRITQGMWSDKCPWEQFSMIIFSAPPPVIPDGTVGYNEIYEDVDAPDMSDLTNGNYNTHGNGNGNGNNGNHSHTPIQVQTESMLAEFNVFPNPAENILNITYSLAEKAQGKIQLTDVTGRILIAANLTEGTSKTQIDLSNVATGTYMINLFEEGALKASEKIVVNK